MPSENTKVIAEVADRQREDAQKAINVADEFFSRMDRTDISVIGALVAEHRADRLERRVQHTENLAAMAELLNRLETLTNRLDEPIRTING